MKRNILNAVFSILIFSIGALLGGFGLRYFNNQPDVANHVKLDAESAEILNQFGFLGSYSIYGGCKKSLTEINGFSVLNDNGVYKRVFSTRGIDGVERGYYLVIESVKKVDDNAFLIVETGYPQLESIVSHGLRFERKYERSGPLISQSNNNRLIDGERYHFENGDWVKGGDTSPGSAVLYRCEN